MNTVEDQFWGQPIHTRSWAQELSQLCGGKTVLPENVCMKNYKKMPELYVTFAQKLTKCQKYYTAFAWKWTKSPNFTWYLPFFWGGHVPLPLPPPPTPRWDVHVSLHHDRVVHKAETLLRLCTCPSDVGWLARRPHPQSTAAAGQHQSLSSARSTAGYWLLARDPALKHAQTVQLTQ